MEVVDPLQVGDEEVAGDDDGGVAQHVEEETEQPHVMPVLQQRRRFTRRQRRWEDQNQAKPKPSARTHTHTHGLVPETWQVHYVAIEAACFSHIFRVMD